MKSKKHDPLDLGDSEVLRNLETICKERLEEDPNDYEALYGVAYLEPDLRKRIRKLDEVLRVNPNHLWSLKRKAYALCALACCIEEENPKRSLKLLKSTLELHKKTMGLTPEEGAERLGCVLDYEDALRECNEFKTRWKKKRPKSSRKHKR